MQHTPKQRIQARTTLCSSYQFRQISQTILHHNSNLHSNQSSPLVDLLKKPHPKLL